MIFFLIIGIPPDDGSVLSKIKGAPERTDEFHRQKESFKTSSNLNFIDTHNSQFNAVYLWSTTFSIRCPWVLIQELRHF